MRRKVWITGIGAITPLGNCFKTFSRRLLNGESAVEKVELLPGCDLPHQFVAKVADIPEPAHHGIPRFAERLPLCRMAISSAVTALEDADYWDQRQSQRIGVSLGMGAEWLRSWENRVHNNRPETCHPQHDEQQVVQILRRDLQLQGPFAVVAAACASGNFALGQGRRWIEQGLVDVCLAGSCDVVTPLAFAGFNNLRALSRYQGDPRRASRPFDSQRDGFVMGEGGAMFLLESEHAARRRGIRVYAELAGFGAASDATHMIIPCEDGRSAAEAQRLALADAGIHPEDVDYVNAHATSTPVGDPAETRSLQRVYGEALEKTPVSSTKSMTGHALSGAAAIEALACIAALEHQALPPTINLDSPDAECRLLHVANEARPHAIQIAASNSFGFGGSNSSIVLRKAA